MTKDELSMYSYATGHPPRVDLFTNDAQTSLGEHLLGLNLYERRDTTKDTRFNVTHPLINLTQDLPRGKVFDIFLTAVEESGDFYVVKKSNEKTLVDIANKLQELATSYKLLPLEKIFTGQICVARYPVEQESGQILTGTFQKFNFDL